MLHRVRKRNYTTPNPVQIPTAIDGERYNVLTGGLSWWSQCYILLFDEQFRHLAVALNRQLGADNYTNTGIFVFVLFTQGQFSQLGSYFLNPLLCLNFYGRKLTLS